MTPRWIAAPAAALLLVTGVTVATGVPASESVALPDDAVLVAELVPGASVTGVEVAARVITWGMEDPGDVGPRSVESDAELDEVPASDYGGTVAGRAYTPDLGQEVLTLGATVVPPISDAISATSNDRWAIGFDPFMDLEGYGLWVKPAGGTAELLTIPPVFGADRSSVSLWGDTALVGTVLVNLNTQEIIAPEPWDGDCIDLRGAALADGVLLANDVCDETVVAVDVPRTGITAAALDGAETVASGYAEQIGYSRGLMVWSTADEDLERIVVRWQRIDQPVGEYDQLVPAAFPWSLRVHGERFVIVSETDGQPAAHVYEAADAAEPVVVVPMAFRMFVSPGLDELAAAQELNGSVALDYMPVDLFGRTLAWEYEGAIYALTLPALSGDPLVIDAPDAATTGDTITVTGSDFAPWEEVAVWLNSDAQLLALVHAAADGTVSATVTIPADAAGSHTLSLYGVESGWDVGSALTVQGVNPGLEVQTG